MKHEQQNALHAHAAMLAEAEAEAAPVLWTPQSTWRPDEGPPPLTPSPPPPINWFWLKVLVWSGVSSLALAVCIAFIYKPIPQQTHAVAAGGGQQNKSDSINTGAADVKVGKAAPKSPAKGHPVAPTSPAFAPLVMTEFPPVGNTEARTGAPPGLFSEDPIKTVEAVNRMKSSLNQVLGNRDTITFLITWPDNDNTYLPFVSTLLSDACRMMPRQCWFTQLGDDRDLDRSRFQGSGKRGITVHGHDVSALANALGDWFTTYSTASLPPEASGYESQATKEIIWIDIGPGSPWKSPSVGSRTQAATAAGGAISPRPPVVIPVPPQTTPRPPVENKSAKPLVARIDGQIVSAADKAPGTLYVSLMISSITRYRGGTEKTTTDAVVAALKQTGKISVFLATGGAYLLYVNDQNFGAGLSPGGARTIYYFDKTLDNSCSAVKTILSNIVGPLDCAYREIPVPTDPNNLGMSLAHDFWVTSGLDMEVVL